MSRSERKVIIFGAGQLGQRFVRETDFPVDYFMDNDEQKRGIKIFGKTVLNPRDLLSFREDWHIIIASQYYSEISSQLREMGYSEGRHFANAYSTKEWAGATVRGLLKRYINQEPELLEQYDLVTLYTKVQDEYIPIARKKGPLSKISIKRKPIDVCGKLPIAVDAPPRGITYLIHGSQADGTYTAFSDIDDIVILNREFFASFDVFAESIVWLQKLNRSYQDYDVTQHHGHWIFTYDELYNLNEAILPACVFEESVSVFGDTIIEYCRIESSPFSQALMNICDQIEMKLHDIYANKINLYSLKHLVSSIALLMPLYYQSKGQLMTKRQAIHTALEQLDNEIVDVLMWSSQLRSNWHRVPTFDEVERFKVRCAAFTNRIVVEKYVSVHAPAISAAALGIERDHFYKKTSEMLRYFRDSVKMTGEL